MQESREPIVAGGYLIRRVDYSPSGATNQGKVRRHFSTNNKENIPYGWRRSPAASRLRRPGRSPLPDWYPRTPLRDITSIVKAYEKRRLRIQAAAAAQASAASPSFTPQPQESSSTAIHHPLEPPMKACHIFTDVPPLPPSSSPQTPALSDGQTRPAEAAAAKTEESPLLDSFEQIEKAVKRNMVTMKKPESKRATQLRSLMSMR